MLTAHRCRRASPGAAAVAVLTAAFGFALMALRGRVDLVMKAAGIPKNAAGLGGFVNGMKAAGIPKNASGIGGFVNGRRRWSTRRW